MKQALTLEQLRVPLEHRTKIMFTGHDIDPSNLIAVPGEIPAEVIERYLTNQVFGEKVKLKQYPESPIIAVWSDSFDRETYSDIKISLQKLKPELQYYYMGQIERGPKYAWKDGYSLNGNTYPWLTRRECQRQARERGCKAVFVTLKGKDFDDLHLRWLK